MNTQAFKIGDIVCLRAAFLRSAGWCLNVPRDGRVEDVSHFNGRQLLYVDWCDGYTTSILAENVIPANRKHLDHA
jgi:hypothetical protein